MSLRTTRYWLAALLVTALLPAGAVRAQSSPAPDQWQAGPEADPAQNVGMGFIDSPANGTRLSLDAPITVNGWVVDRRAQGWSGFDAVHLYAGKAGEGGRLLAIGTLPTARPDVATALANPYWASSGFEAVVPAGLLPLGPTTLTLYAHSPDKGWWYKQVTVTVARPQLAQPILEVSQPRPMDKLKMTQEYTITGFALDPGARELEDSGVARVEVYINGERTSQGSQLVGIADVGDPDDSALARYGPRFALAGWRLKFEPRRFRAGNTSLFIYARSMVTAGEALATIDINIVEN